MRRRAGAVRPPAHRPAGHGFAPLRGTPDSGRRGRVRVPLPRRRLRHGLVPGVRPPSARRLLLGGGDRAELPLAEPGLVRLLGHPRPARGARALPHPRRRLGALPDVQEPARRRAGLRRPGREPRDRALLPRQALRPRLREHAPDLRGDSREGDDLLRGRGHGRPGGPDDLARADPRVPAAGHEAHDRPRARRRRVRVPPQRRRGAAGSCPT